MVIDFDEDLCWLACIGERECFFKAKVAEKTALTSEVCDAKRHMRNSFDLRSLCFTPLQDKEKHSDYRRGCPLPTHVQCLILSSRSGRTSSSVMKFSSYSDWSSQPRF